MRIRLTAGLLAVFLVAAAGCQGGFLAKQYEYEEDVTLYIDGSAVVVVNSSLAALAALRGLPVPTDSNERLDRDQIRALFESPVSEVTRVSRAWRRKGRRFVQIRVDVPDIRRLGEAPPFAWSKYQFAADQGKHVFKQTVGASALQPGTLKNYGWDGSEIVAFRLHLPSKILFQNSRDIDTNEPAQTRRGNIVAWEQQLADRLDGRQVDIHVEMESQSILYRTLWLFGAAFLAAILVLAFLIWWTMRRGKDHDEPAITNP